MRKSVDFGNGERGKHAGTALEVAGAAKTVWAVYIEKSSKELIQLKLYRIESYSRSSEVRVINENGETALYPKNWFETLMFLRKHKIC